MSTEDQGMIKHSWQPPTEPQRTSIAREEAEYLRDVAALVDALRHTSWPEDETTIVHTVPIPHQDRFAEVQGWLEEIADWVEQHQAPVEDLRRWLRFTHGQDVKTWERRDYAPWAGFIQ